MTLIERLQALVSRLSFGYSERRTVDDAIEAVAERDKLHADIETLRLDLDGLKLIEGERTRLAIKCDALTGEVAEIVKVKEYFRTQLERAESTIALLQTERDEMRDLRDQARRHEGEWAPRLVEVCKQRDAHASALASCHGEISILKMQRDDLAAQVEHYRGETREAKLHRQIAIDERNALWNEGAKRAVDFTRPAPPSPLNLVERVLRLEREVLFVRQRPTGYPHAPRNPPRST